MRYEIIIIVAFLRKQQQQKKEDYYVSLEFFPYSLIAFQFPDEEKHGRAAN